MLPSYEHLILFYQMAGRPAYMGVKTKELFARRQH